MKMRTTAIAALMAAGLVTACGGADEAAPASETPAADTPAPAAETPAPAEEPQPSEAPATETAEADTSAQFAGFPEPYASADYATGRRVFMQCSSCHSLAEGGPTLLGPNLHGLFDREVGGLDNYEYSSALQEASFQWTPDQLEEWLASPRNFLPGNKMSFAGVPRPDQRHAVIAYIMSETGYTAE